MKTLKLSLALLAATVLLALPACVTKNPAHVPGDTNSPAYLPDPRIEALHQQVKGVSDAVAPFNPYAVITSPAVEAGFALAAAIAVIVARRKSATADTLAAGLVKAGPAAVDAALTHAGDSPSFANVAALINEHTSANQTPSGKPIPPLG